MFISQSSWHDSTFILQPIVSSTQTGILSFFVQGFLHMLDGCYRSLSVFTLALSVGRLRAPWGIIGLLCAVCMLQHGGTEVRVRWNEDGLIN